MWREEKKNAQLLAERLIGNLEARLHEQDGGMRIGGNFLDDPIAAIEDLTDEIAGPAAAPPTRAE